MQSFSEWLKLALNIAGLLTLGAVGLFAALGIFDKARRTRITDADAIDSRLIEGFKNEMSLQSGVINRMEGELKEIRDNNLKLVSENKTLRDILQGRDDSTLKYQSEGRTAMSQIKVIFDTQEKTVASIDRLANAIENLVAKETVIESHTTTTLTPATGG